MYESYKWNCAERESYKWNNTRSKTMTERLTRIVLELQRLSENAHLKGNDLQYNHQQEIYDHVEYLDQLLMFTEKLRNSLLEDRKRFLPVARGPDQEIKQDVPKFIQQGPRKEQANG